MTRGRVHLSLTPSSVLCQVCKHCFFFGIEGPHGVESDPIIPNSLLTKCLKQHRCKPGPEMPSPENQCHLNKQLAQSWHQVEKVTNLSGFYRRMHEKELQVLAALSQTCLYLKYNIEGKHVNRLTNWKSFWTNLLDQDERNCSLFQSS